MWITAMWLKRTPNGFPLYSTQSHPEPDLSFAVLHTKPESADDAKEDIYQHKDHQGDFVIRLPFFLTQLLFTERGEISPED